MTMTDTKVHPLPYPFCGRAPIPDEAPDELDETIRRGTEKWKDVPGDWLEDLRGGPEA